MWSVWVANLCDNIQPSVRSLNKENVVLFLLKFSFYVLQEVSDKNMKLHYLNETNGTEEQWTLCLATLASVDTIIESIQEPWQQLFSVPLQIS